MDRGLRAGISGALLAIIINLFSPRYLDFVPSFVAAMIVIYIFGLRSIQEGLIAAFATYIFNEGVLGTLSLVTLYLENLPYEVSLDQYIIFSPIINSITAVIAGYLGVKLVQRLKQTAKETQPPSSFPPPQEPIPPV